MRTYIAAAAAVVMLMLTSCAIGTDGGQSKSSETFFAMDTYVTVTAYGDNADGAVKAAKDKLTQLEKLWSVTDEGSEIYAINHSGGQPVTVSDNTAELISFALDMSDKTDGALDPTIYPVLTAWGFTTDENRVPDESEIAELLGRVGHEKVSISGNSVSLQSGVMLDVGAVGKGFAGDILTQEMKDSGVTSALLDLGGNIQMIGTKPDGENWRIGLRDPKGDGNIGVLSAADCAVVTSGSYERYFTADDGKVYGHIIDPKTGYPVDNGLLSVTVIASEGRLCDALSTALFVMGLDGAQDYRRQHTEQSFDMILITSGGYIYITEGIKDSFTLDGEHSRMEIKVIE